MPQNKRTDAARSCLGVRPTAWPRILRFVAKSIGALHQFRSLPQRDSHRSGTGLTWKDGIEEGGFGAVCRRRPAHHDLVKSRVESGAKARSPLPGKRGGGRYRESLRRLRRSGYLPSLFKLRTVQVLSGAVSVEVFASKIAERIPCGTRRQRRRAAGRPFSVADGMSET